jgi:hypothetical protein
MQFLLSVLCLGARFGRHVLFVVYLAGTRHLCVRNTLFWSITQRVVVIPCRRFGTTYRFRLQVSTIQEFLNSRPLKMGPICCPETSIRNYHYTLPSSPEMRSSHLLLGGSLKSHVWMCLVKGNWLNGTFLYFL